MFKKILVPVDIDYPDIAAAVYGKAEELAALCGAQIRLVGILPGFGMPIVGSFITETLVRQVNDKFKQALEAFIKDHCGKTVTYAIRTGKHWEQIIDAAGKWEADLIVVYHNRRVDVNEAFSNACAQRVAEHAPCSVLRLRQLPI